MRLFSCFFVPLLGFFLLGVTGCTNPDARYVKVEGVVTYNQQPVEDATVMFMPTGTGNDLELASYITDASGKFAMTSAKAVKPGTGVLPGEYIVLITKYETLPVSPHQEAYERGEITYGEYTTRESRYQEPVAKSLIPEKYSQKDKTGLKVTVEPSKNPPFNFDLTD